MSSFLSNRLNRLEKHLSVENPALLEVLPTYYKFDQLLYRTGLLDRDTSLASRISWWPLISVLGTFSAGKSSFINSYVGETLQSTGNQAVDDKFTVICHRAATTAANQTLPGSALDADPRFPFYRISHEIEKVAQGEGKHIESYLQLRTTSNERIKSKIIIDSPGFDADDQRTSTLRITDHILDLSDLVLVFFDARHPEPGAMQDTLEHLVSRTVSRTDASKFLYILNQIDTAAKEDNPEEITGAWQRAMAQAGLTSGQFYTIYNEDAAIPIADMALRERFQAKRDADLKKIIDRMDEVELQRNYRIVSVLETVANELEHDILPKLRDAKARWRRGVLIGDGIAAGLLIAAAIAAAITFKWVPSFEIFTLPWINSHLFDIAVGGIGALILLVSFHYWVRGVVAKRVAAPLAEKYGQVDLNLKGAFLKSAGAFHSIFSTEPAGWSKRAAKKLRLVRETVATHIQSLNDRYADPSGKIAAVIEDQSPVVETLTETPAETANEKAE
ncbi:MAG: dynamin family protein [Rhodobacterales bacterium]|nr:dynamin family protein [Rhodobacterales bacterium]